MVSVRKKLRRLDKKQASDVVHLPVVRCLYIELNFVVQFAVSVDPTDINEKSEISVEI